MEIPRTLHLIWLGGARPKGYEADSYWKKILDESWTVKLWTDDSLLPVSSHVQSVLETAHSLAPRSDGNRWKSDILRMAILNAEGGMYSDLDAQPLRGIDDLVGRRPAWFAESPNNPGGSTNAAMGFPAGHPMLRDYLDGLPERTKEFAGSRTAKAVGGHYIDVLIKSHDDIELLPW